VEEEEQERIPGTMEVVPQEIERAKALEKDEAPRNDRTILIMAKMSSQCVFVPDLITIVKYDERVDAKCKAISDLSQTHDIELLGVYNFLKKITTQNGYEKMVYDTTVQNRAKEVMVVLKPRVMALPIYSKRPELQKLVSG